MIDPLRREARTTPPISALRPTPPRVWHAPLVLAAVGLMTVSCKVAWPADPQFVCAGPGDACAGGSPPDTATVFVADAGGRADDTTTSGTDAAAHSDVEADVDGDAVAPCVSAAACDDGKPCTTDGCDAKSGCTHVANSAGCDDGNACTKVDTCSGGACAGSGALSCDDGKPCTTDGCDAKSGCTHVANSDGCDDGNACTKVDTCSGGGCVGSGVLNCDDSKPCTTDGCDAKSGCTHAANSDGCDDSVPCTINDTCSGGVCAGTPSAAKCGDGNDCTSDSCDAQSGCKNPNASGACNDGDACTMGESCSNGQCKGGAAKSCNDDIPCTVDTCDAKAGCAHTPMSYGACCQALGGAAGGTCVWKDTKGTEWGLVPAGTFFMGCNATLDSSCGPDEKPQHEVAISQPFWLGLTEVTVAQYKACVDAGKCEPPASGAGYVHDDCKDGSKRGNWTTSGPVSGREQHPLNCVTWARAAAFCSWAGGYLPTEAQWELAARGRCDENGGYSGCAAKMRVYPWGKDAPVCGKHAVFSSGGNGCGQDRTWVVMTGSGSGRGPYGHYDLSGNVWEWVRDWYSSSFYKSVKATDPENTNSASYRVYRGGSFVYDFAASLRAGNRYGDVPSYAYAYFGLRCARSFP